MITEQQVKDILIEETSDEDPHPEEYLDDMRYADVIDIIQTIIYKLELSFWIAELIIVKDDFKTIVYCEQKDTYHIIGDSLPEDMTIKGITKWLNEMQDKCLSFIEEEQEEDINI